MNDNDSIGDRFKEYERVFDHALPRRLPMVIRVDGRAFHGLKLYKPFDALFFERMGRVSAALCKEISGSVLAYFQSDEISVIVRDDMAINTMPWVGKRLSKVLSLSAAVATSAFNHESAYGPRQFDSRAFVLPDLEEVTNYLIWRQQDATRNSVSMAARAAFSHKSLHGVKSNDMIDRLREHGTPWEDTPTHFKRGAVCRPVKVLKLVEFTGDTVERRDWQIDMDIPIFTQDRSYVETLFKLPGVENGAT